MKIIRSIKPMLLGASALVLVSCGQQTASSMLPATVVQNGEQTLADKDSGMKAIADDLAASGQHEAAIPMYRHLAKRTGDRNVRVALAKSLSALGAHRDALGVMTEVATLGSMDSESYYTLGKTHLALGQFDLAHQSFLQAKNVTPVHEKVASGEAIALAAMGRTREAMMALQNTIDPVDLSNRALIMATTGDTKVAVATLEQLVQSGQLGPQGRQNLAMAYLLDGREGDAYRVARLDLDPATINDTFTFYRSLESLAPANRMQALVTGIVDPSWTRDESGNLQLADTSTSQEAAERIVKQNIMVAQAPKPAPKQEELSEEPPVEVAQADYELTEVPPLVEPEGWALQIGAYRNLKNLMRGWTILYRESGDLLKDIPPRRSEVNFGSRDSGPKGFYYRLNAGPLKTFAQAKTLCAELKKRGTSCWIRPPEKDEGALPAKDDARPQSSPAQTASLG